ncbi:hypothetical protein FisN_16Lu312 [Fistulifera solaris]|uniref:Uncharacterized protein n=1 Tax=Fistulifera solaris TaxID=1519565 RepID=A0A1Z5KNU2_FISSO|nr:hypothetical protein FisN_16Lu312 [Fistulifera solaris]|eukprot:GAX27994.1 hypothetical protein FisN_16Lu312 [Fistulifera solaris]
MVTTAGAIVGGSSIGLVGDMVPVLSDSADVTTGVAASVGLVEVVVSVLLDSEYITTGVDVAASVGVVGAMVSIFLDYGDVLVGVDVAGLVSAMLAVDDSSVVTIGAAVGTVSFGFVGAVVLMFMDSR